VLVRNLAGEELELKMPDGSTALDAKQRIAKQWPSYPVECLQLLGGTAPLADAQPLDSLGAGGGGAVLTAVVSLERLKRGVTADSPEAARSAALEAFAEFAPPADDGAAVALAAACLEARESGVRRAATKAMVRLSQRGHAGTFEAVVASLACRDPVVRVAGALTLQLLVPRGDDAMAAAMARLLNDTDAEVRRIALHVLTRAFDRGDKRVVAMAVAHLQEPAHMRTCGLCELLWTTPQEALELFETGHALILDSRDEEAFEAGRILYALSLPGHTLEQLRRLQGAPAFQAVQDDASKTAIVYSDTGSDRSRCHWVAQTLRESPRVQPFRVLRLVGGLDLWRQQGLPVTGGRGLAFAGHRAFT